MTAEPSPAPATPLPDDPDASEHSHSPQGSLTVLALGAMGVVYGDIGTSPLYALQAAFSEHSQLKPDRLHVCGVISLVFWSLLIVVTGKYILLTLRADNKGEGGSLALLALIQRRTGGTVGRWSQGLVLLGVLATALFFGDCMITPAISVLSAVEGLEMVETGFAPYVLPISVVILVGLFLLQARGSSKLGQFFGPVMAVYFVALALLGLVSIIKDPDILWALNPYYAFHFFAFEPKIAFLALGSVVLALTGAEALYADMGHFGRRPIQVAWFYLILPALMLNYLGQGALLLRDQSAARNPFFLLADESLRLPLVILATLATIIASQAVITGAFSVCQQAVQLGLMPRLRILHTSASALGQIYLPAANWALMMMVLVLVAFFRQSANLAAAYGIAVTGTMLITSCMLLVLLRRVWHWPLWLACPLIALWLLFDIAYFLSNTTKIHDGGWFPLMIGTIAFILLTTWSKGRSLMIERLREVAMPVRIFIQSAANAATRVPGTAVFMTASPEGVPHALLHNLKHNKVLHDRVVLLTVKILDVPYVPDESRYKIEDLGSGFHRLVLRFGFMQDADVPAAMKLIDSCGAPFKMETTSFFLARQTLLPSARPGMAIWREKLFAWMLRNAESAMEFFRLPTNRVVELGSQVEI